MKQIVKKIIFLPQVIFDGLYNLFLFKFTSTKYETRPRVKGRLHLRNYGSFTIGKKAVINSKYAANPIGGDSKTTFFVANDAQLKIGHNLNISNSTIFCKHMINIGNNVMIGGSTKIYDTDFHSIYVRERCLEGDIGAVSLPVIIEDNVFIGGHSIILKGVTIKRGSVIGAGSVVAKSTGENEIWAGNPAVLIKKINQE